MERMGKKFKKKRSMKNPVLHPTKLDMEITKYLRFKIPRKSTVMQKQAVEYFLGNKAVDTLMESKWATRKKGVDQLFVSREDAASYLDELLHKKFFYRVEKIELSLKSKTDKNEQSKNKSDKTEQSEKLSENKNAVEEVPTTQETTLRRRKKEKLTNSTEDEKNEDSESNKVKGKVKNKSAKDKKSKDKEVTKVKKRYKLIPHNDQVFFDSKDIYVWIYNPVSWKTIIMGIGVLLCVVAATLFPLWPPEVRLGVYYLSVAGGIFIGSIFGIALARSVLWAIIWVFTGGKHHLWVLPNLLADVGFWESFKPYYTYEYRGSKDKKDEEENEDDDEEEEDDKEEQEEENEEKLEEKDNDEEQQENQESVDEQCKTDTGSPTEVSTERSESES